MIDYITSKFGSTNQIRALLLLFGLFIAFVFVFYPVWRSLIAAWYNSEEYSHGFLILPICLYIVYQKRDRLRQLSIEPSLWSGWLLPPLLIVYLFSYLAEINTLSSITMILVMISCAIYLLGWSIFRELQFPFSLLLFMVPIPAQIYSALTIPLQLLVSKLSVATVQILDLPIYREGNVIHLPGRTLQVVQACSGLRSMISLLTLAAVFGYLTLDSNINRILLVATALPTAILVNIVRVFLMVIVYHFWNYDLTEGSVHTYFGSGIFLLAIMILALFKGVLLKWDKSLKKI